MILLPAFVVSISREIVRLATEYAGVDKLPEYLRSVMKVGKKSTYLDSGHYILSNGQLSKNYSPPAVVKAHASERSFPRH